MTFDKILEDGRLWAVRYEEGKSNCFEMLFSNWYDMSWLKSFFEQNILDLASFFHNTLAELAKMERVRNYLLDNGVFDIDGIKDLANEQSN